jgi:F0F1-type ATP synthase assembly protein I
MVETGTGANDLARDSKLGLAVTFVGGVVLDAAIGALTDVDTSSWNGWWVPLVSVGISTALGALTAYKAKRRTVR